MLKYEQSVAVVTGVDSQSDGENVTAAVPHHRQTLLPPAWAAADLLFPSKHRNKI